MPMPAAELQRRADEIATLARQGSTGNGRPSRLCDAGVVATLLAALAGGCSQTAAAKRAGLSEGAIRVWLGPAGRPVDACAALASAIRDLGGATPRAAVPSFVLSGPPLSVVPPPPVPRVPLPPPPSAPSLPENIAREVADVRITADRVRREHGEAIRARYLAPIAACVRAYGVDVFPDVSGVLLPRGLEYTEVVRRYLAWCTSAAQAIPSEMALDASAWNWYRTWQAPASITG